MDVTDEATRLEEAHRADSLAALARPQAPRLDLRRVVRCEDCGDRILVARLRLVPNATRCTDCQKDADFRERRRA